MNGEDIIVMKQIKKKKFWGIAFTLIVLTYAFTSSSVYAKSSMKMTVADSKTVAEPDEEELLLEQSLPDNIENIVIPENRVPLVQSMTCSTASIKSLYQENSCDSFYEHTVFVGDSLSVGFANYCKNHPDSLATDTTYFLAKESCSARIAISSNALTTHADVMPSYNGSVQYIEDSIAQMADIEKVFICYGMNDLVGSSPEKYIEDMQTLITRILAKNPDVTIYVISIPCIMEDAESGLLSNASIQAANHLLQTTCETNGWGFVNLSEYLMNSSLSICAEYSSDGYVHENNAAYAVWVKVLRNYAYKDMTT